MSLRLSELITNLLGAQSVAQFGVQSPGSDVGSVDFPGEPPVAGCGAYLNALPSNVPQSVAFVRENLAVVPEDWTNGGISQCHQSRPQRSFKLTSASLTVSEHQGRYRSFLPMSRAHQILQLHRV